MHDRFYNAAADLDQQDPQAALLVRINADEELISKAKQLVGSAGSPSPYAYTYAAGIDPVFTLKISWQQVELGWMRTKDFIAEVPKSVKRLLFDPLKQVFVIEKVY